jgi:hypothetical protein
MKIGESSMKRINAAIMNFRYFFSFVRRSRLNWIGYVNRKDIKIKVSYVFNNNP